MKKLLFVAATLVMMANAFVASAQNKRNLPAPNMERETLSFMNALNERKSVRDYALTPLSEQDLSDLLWAAQGKNRKDGRMTSPTARNKQEILLYVFTANGVELYNHDEHSLTQVLEGDHRSLFAAGQAFAKKAPVCLLMVVDFKKFGSRNEHATMMAFCDAGIVSENINLFCASTGMCTVTRGMMDSEGLSKLLGLTEDQVPVLNNPVGYAK